MLATDQVKAGRAVVSLVVVSRGGEVSGDWRVLSCLAGLVSLGRRTGTAAQRTPATGRQGRSAVPRTWWSSPGSLSLLTEVDGFRGPSPSQSSQLNSYLVFSVLIVLASWSTSLLFFSFLFNSFYLSTSVRVAPASVSLPIPLLFPQLAERCCTSSTLDTASRNLDLLHHCTGTPG